MFDHLSPSRCIVVGAVDPHAIHAALDKVANERVIVRRLARHGDHDPNPATPADGGILSVGEGLPGPHRPWLGRATQRARGRKARAWPAAVAMGGGRDTGGRGNGRGSGRSPGSWREPDRGVPPTVPRRLPCPRGWP
jgi:hypothetical protein